jgi:O-antigen/teichoic acid export membrane protein
VCAFAVAGLWLLSRSIVDIFAAEDFAEAHEAIGLLATGVALYALYLALVVILGRTGRTEFNFPATAAGTAANIVLNLVLIPPLGIVGAGLALVGSYVIVLALMYVLTQRLFPVPYEWGRLALLVVVTAATIGIGELALPKEGIAAILTRGALWLAMPVLLLATGFLTREERSRLRAMLAPSAVRARLRAVRSAPRPSEPAAAEAEPGSAEIYEQVARDQDRGGV